MAAFGAISPEKLFRLLGSSRSPILIDVRQKQDLADRPTLVPSSFHRNAEDLETWSMPCAGRDVVVVCKRGLKLSEGVAAHLRLNGIRAEILEGGLEGWLEAGLPVVPISSLPDERPTGQSLWVTRCRPKIDRIACPWLIRRFVDPAARFLFVSASEVQAVAQRFDAIPFDIEGVHWSHRGELCTFDMMVEAFGLKFSAMERVAEIVRGADTDRLDLAPQSAGLLAISLGLSRLHSSDLEQLDEGMLIYDALYRWARDAMDEKHNWVSHGGKGRQP